MNKSEKRSANNVLSFYDAIKAGYEPADYPFQAEQIPSGEYNAILDFMVTARSLDAIELFCRVEQTGQKFRISYFKDKEQRFDLNYNKVAAITFASLLSIQVEKNGRDKPTLHRIVILPRISGKQSEPGVA